MMLIILLCYLLSKHGIVPLFGFVTFYFLPHELCLLVSHQAYDVFHVLVTEGEVYTCLSLQVYNIFKTGDVESLTGRGVFCAPNTLSNSNMSFAVKGKQLRYYLFFPFLFSFISHVRMFFHFSLMYTCSV